jgi:hypothetical protein
MVLSSGMETGVRRVRLSRFVFEGSGAFSAQCQVTSSRIAKPVHISKVAIALPRAKASKNVKNPLI